MLTVGTMEIQKGYRGAGLYLQRTRWCYFTRADCRLQSFCYSPRSTFRIEVRSAGFWTQQAVEDLDSHHNHGDQSGSPQVLDSTL